MKNLIEASAAHGILLAETGEAKLYDNVLRGNDEAGIHLLDSRQNHLFRNEAQGNLDGFGLAPGTPFSGATTLTATGPASCSATGAVRCSSSRTRCSRTAPASS